MHLEYKYRAIDLGTCYPRLGTFYSRPARNLLYPRHFRWTRAISIDSRPAPYRLSPVSACHRALLAKRLEISEHGPRFTLPTFSIPFLSSFGRVECGSFSSFLCSYVLDNMAHSFGSVYLKLQETLPRVTWPSRLV
jgi:hypothetical protein